MKKIFLGKSQYIRVWDILFLAPFLVWTGGRAQSTLEKNILVSAGLLTGAFNAYHFVRRAKFNRKMGRSVWYSADLITNTKKISAKSS